MRVTGMGDSDEERGKRKEEFQRLTRSRLTRNERILLSLFDVLMIGMLLTDMAYFVGFLKDTNLMYLALLNVAVVAVGYASFRIKRAIGRQVAKEILEERKEEVEEAKGEDPLEMG